MVRLLLSTLATASLCAGLPACGSSAPSRDAGPGDGDAPDGDVASARPDECDYPRSGYGYTPGDVVDPFYLWSCDEETTSLPRLWCGRGVTIVHLSATWCFLCQNATTLLVRDVLPELEGEPVELVEVLLEGEEHGVVATAEDCETWSSYYAPPVTTYIPVGGVIAGPLAELAHELPAPSTILLDRAGRIRYRSQVVLPDHLESQTHQLLLEIQEILAE